MRLALQGASIGKTYSSLLIAHGMTSDWSKIAVIDTENGVWTSMPIWEPIMYCLSEPYNPEKYIDAIGIRESAGMGGNHHRQYSHC